MPNQRDPEKRMVGVWLLPQEIRAWDKAVQLTGAVDRAEWLRQRLALEIAFLEKPTRRKTS